MLPPGYLGAGLLVLVDLSGWTHRAYALAGVEGMAGMVISWLVRLLEPPAPACVAVAVDSSGPTWRHLRTAALPPLDRYKARRERKPAEFYAQSRRILEIVGLHRIPCLWAEGFEADDVIAAATREARDLGLDVVIVTRDKDLGQLITEDGEVPSVRLWDGAAGVVGPEEIRSKWGVPPSMLGDALAVVGDAADNVQGVRGMGERAAAEVLTAFGSLDVALATPPPDDELAASLAAEVKRLEKARAKAQRGDDFAARNAVDEQLAGVRAQVALGKLLARLHEAADVVREARVLVGLDASAPLAWDVEQLPVGGFDVPRLVPLYRDLGLARAAAEVRAAPKARLEDVLPARSQSCIACSGSGLVHGRLCAECDGSGTLAAA